MRVLYKSKHDKKQLEKSFKPYYKLLTPKMLLILTNAVKKFQCDHYFIINISSQMELLFSTIDSSGINFLQSRINTQHHNIFVIFVGMLAWTGIQASLHMDFLHSHNARVEILILQYCTLTKTWINYIEYFLNYIGITNCLVLMRIKILNFKEKLKDRFYDVTLQCIRKIQHDRKIVSHA